MQVGRVAKAAFNTGYGVAMKARAIPFDAGRDVAVTVADCPDTGRAPPRAVARLHRTPLTVWTDRNTGGHRAAAPRRRGLARKVPS